MVLLLVLLRLVMISMRTSPGRVPGTAITNESLFGLNAHKPKIKHKQKMSEITEKRVCERR
jgi:hypothetical protein